MNTKSLRYIFSIIVFIGAAAILLIRPFPLPPDIGEGDFRPYWSSSYLLARGQDFSDPSNMDKVERELTDWTKPFTMHAWFFPTGNLILLPYTFLSYANAVYYWLLTNIVVLFLSAILNWPNRGIGGWIPLIATFGFSMTLVSLISGQVNTFVLLGLVLFLYFGESKREFAAGFSLVLTTIKPHLVILTLPLLLLDIARRKQWRTLIGFFGTLAVCAFILFVLNPAWPFSFWKVVTSGMGTVRETPTLNGLLVISGEFVWGKWIWPVVLLLAAAAWWKRGAYWNRRILIDGSILVGLFVSPIGWSYDQILLLIPVLSVLGWIVDGSLSRQDSFAVGIAVVLVNVLSFYQRLQSVGDVWYFWIPIMTAVIYAFALRRRHAIPLSGRQELLVST